MTVSPNTPGDLSTSSARRHIPLTADPIRLDNGHADVDVAVRTHASSGNVIVAASRLPEGKHAK